MRAPVTRSEAVAAFTNHLQASLQDGSFVRLVLSSPIQAETGPERVLGRLIEIKGEPRLSLTFRFDKRDETKNLSIPDGVAWVRSQLEADFSNALLGTTRQDWQFSAPPKKPIRLVRHPASQRRTPDRTHDQGKDGLLDDSATDWLHQLAVTDEQGRVRPGMSAKFTQVNRYLEILSHLVKE